MAANYTSTIEVNLWKEHECSRCGTLYRYLFKRKKTGRGNSPDAASKSAHAAVAKALEREVDLQPCPGCGLYQPDMIAARRGRRHWCTFWIGVPIFGLLLILVLADVLVFSSAAFLAAVAAAVLSLAHLIIDARNPNANLDANLELARRREQAGDLWVPEGGKGSGAENPVGTGTTRVRTACYVLLVAAVLAFLVPEAVRLQRGMISNAGWYPQAVGTGEEAYVYFPDSVTSIKGLWSARASASLINEEELGLARPGIVEPKRLPAPPPPLLPARSRTETWGGTLHFKSSEKDKSSRLWAYVRLPDKPDLVGKTLDIRVELDVSYPVYMDANRGVLKSMHYSHRLPLTVSPGRAADTYVRTWWFGFLAGLSLTLTCGAFLAAASRRFRKMALPTRVFVPEDPEEKEVRESDERIRR
jgi:hypothetical protein